MNQRRATRLGFSLVEVMIAIAVIAFSVSVMMTLLPVALASLKDSSDNTAIAAMADSVFSSLKGQNFYTPTATGSVLTSTTDVSTGSHPLSATQTIYFDGSGTRLLNSGADLTSTAQALAAGGVYQCTITQIGDYNTLGSTGSNGSATTQQINQLNVSLVFVWPLQAASQSAPMNSKIFNACFTR
jgi:uncharacterized protein (TIGR02598 family)